VTAQRTISTAHDSDEAAGEKLVPQAYLVRLLDGEEPLVPSSRHSLAAVDAASIGRGSRGAERVRTNGVPTLQLGEPNTRVSGTHACVRRVLGSWILEDRNSKNGTFVAGKRIESVHLRDGDVFQIGRTFFLFRDGVAVSADEPSDVMADVSAHPGEATLYPPFARKLAELDAIAGSIVSVVIHGETGTGKSSSPEASTRGRGVAGRSSRSTAARSPNRWWRASCSA
jgi:pSer/pThr/pTyr-binding forkhead associated (FHA) protein